MRLVGYVDGVEISFNFYPPNVYKVAIPKKLSGRYIVQLKAIDDAGNEAGTAGIYACIDFQKMTFNILDEKYKSKIRDINFGYMENGSDYFARELKQGFDFAEVYNRYSYRELVM